MGGSTGHGLLAHAGLLPGLSLGSWAGAPVWSPAQGREAEPGVGRPQSQGSREACEQPLARTPWGCAHLEARAAASLDISFFLFCNGREPVLPGASVTPIALVPRKCGRHRNSGQ